MNLRPILLPLLALVVAAALVGVHLVAGGADFVPARAADPCRDRPLGPRADGLEPLTEALVLSGVQRAACTLGVTRERLILALPSARDRRAIGQESGRGERGVVHALWRGLDGAVVRLDRAGRLPRASVLRDAYAGELGLPGIAEEAVRRIPDSVVDDLLPTGPVLRRALRQVDLESILRDLDQPDALQSRLRAAIKAAALAEARARLIEKIPGPIRSLFSLG
ncbi:MAG: hypothetical protein JWN65_2187 [Solirubrobacterales bacterium]|nr:hypothetical protein [Solirubrobacterales bacterium]